MAAAGLVVTGAIGYMATHSRRVYEADHRVRRMMRRRSTRARNRAAKAVSMLGEPSVQVPLSLGLGALIARHRRSRIQDPTNLAPTVAVLAAIGAHHTIKAVFPRKRPLSARLSGKTEPSYPSGHTATMTALAAAAIMAAANRRPGANTSGTSSLAFRRTALAGAVAAPVVVGLARVYSGRHWISDVVGGSVLGLAIAASTRWLLLTVPWRVSRSDSTTL